MSNFKQTFLLNQFATISNIDLQNYEPITISFLTQILKIFNSFFYYFQFLHLMCLCKRTHSSWRSTR